MDLNLFDIIVLTLITILGLKGLIRGFIKEVFGLVGIVGGVFVASRISKPVGELINNLIPIDNESTRLLFGFIVSIVGFWAIAYLIGIAISKISSLSGLGIFDRLFGFIFGAAKVFLIFSIIIYAISQVEAIKNSLDKKTNGSIMYPILQEAGSYIIKLDTTKLQNGMSSHVNGAIEATKETIEEISTEVIQEKIEKINTK
ncbi:MAG: CvpA family protein [Campylobacteraceae bacterium]|nr:CvpA family protein [Campylobacteraceae bacterium]MBT3882275.1 CvpA family protein [Campylobacteraceae bacterium]MBT4030319.1 CvpA family protein [Campylobacteraceae bacterium]MBT4179171.1 CvpA family protein [Campylobacteraceae bacterium]MBT4572367.1 CvpA family protein [Campylobacteraceae bacterium]